jgi:hypothetical protein
MRQFLTAAVATLVIALTGPNTFAHEVDEYLQAALIAPERDHIDVQLRLTPGAAVFAKVFAAIDTNEDAELSDQEKSTYAQRVVHDLAFTLNGQSLTPQIVSAAFPTMDAMKEGLGEIHIALRLPVENRAATQKLIFENHHQSAISAYLVNCLLPQDRSMKIIAQRRSEDQSRYELDYE